MKTPSWFVCVAAAATILCSCAGGKNPSSGQAGGKVTQATTGAAGETLRMVRARGRLLCGVSTGLVGFSAPDASGQYQGFDVDFCRAVAAAVFGDASKVDYRPVTTTQRFVALQSGEVDLLARNSVWTMSRDTQLGMEFAAITFYEGQGFMVRQDRRIASARQLGGAKVCVQAGTTTEWNLIAYGKAKGIALQPVAFAENDQARAAYDAGGCDAYTADATALAGERTALADPAAHTILPERISKEPLAPVIRQGDNQWADILRWTHFAMLTAEELGITAANVDGVRQGSQEFAVKALLGGTGSMGRSLGLADDWAYKIIKQVGNYGEVFQRNLTYSLGIERALNAPWNKGGLQYAPPMR